MYYESEQGLSAAYQERDEALRARDLARAASNRDLQAKREAKAERDSPRREVTELQARVEFLLGLWADDDLDFCGDDIDFRWPRDQRMEYFRKRMEDRLAAEPRP